MKDYDKALYYLNEALKRDNKNGMIENMTKGKIKEMIKEMIEKTIEKMIN